MGVNTGNNDANGSNTGSGSGGSDRRRRSGVTAVMQRPGTVDDFLVLYIYIINALYYMFYITSTKVYYDLLHQLV